MDSRDVEQELRRVRGRGKLGRRDEQDDALMLAVGIATANGPLFELSMFDFRRDKT